MTRPRHRPAFEPLLRIQPQDPNALPAAMAHMQDHNYRKAAELLIEPPRSPKTEIENLLRL